MLSAGKKRGHQLFLVMILFLFMLIPAAAWSQTPVTDGNWNQLTDTGVLPGVRRWAAMAYNPACDETLLFGGYTPSPSPSVFDNHTYIRKDGNWTNVTPASPGTDPNYPKGRVGGEMVYDSRRQVMVMWGGYASEENGNAVIYEYECGTQTWTKVLPTLTSGTWPDRKSYLHQIAYDESRGIVVYIGGGISLTSLYQGNVLEYDPASNEVYAACTSTACTAIHPANRLGHAMTYDKRNGYVLMYGGQNGNGYLRDTWIWDGSRFARLEDESPGDRYESRLVNHPYFNRTLLIGGWKGAPVYFNDVWSWSGKQWELLIPEPDATEFYSDRYGFRALFDESMNRLFLFGGEGPTGHLNDSWEFELYCDRYPNDSGSNQLFQRLCTQYDDTGNAPLGVYDSMQAPVFMDGSSYYVSSTSDSFTQIAVDDNLVVEQQEVTPDLSCSREPQSCEQTTMYEEGTPIEDWLDPVTPINVSDLLNPNGMTLFELNNDALYAENWGNMPLYLMRDCSINVTQVPAVTNVPGIPRDDGNNTLIRFLSRNGAAFPFYDAPMELQVAYGLLHELRADGDFSRVYGCNTVPIKGDLVTDHQLTDATLNEFQGDPFPGEGFYYLVREVTDVSEPVRPFCSTMGFGTNEPFGPDPQNNPISNPNPEFRFGKLVCTSP